MNSMNDHAQDPARLPKPRRDYKDTLFRLLFRDRNRLLSLYNAVNGTFCSSPEDLIVVTLENAVVGPHVSIEKGSIIRDSVVRNTIVRPQVTITNAVVANSMLGARSSVHGEALDLSIGDDSTIG